MATISTKAQQFKRKFLDFHEYVLGSKIQLTPELKVKDVDGVLWALDMFLTKYRLSYRAPANTSQLTKYKTLANHIEVQVYRLTKLNDNFVKAIEAENPPPFKILKAYITRNLDVGATFTKTSETPVLEIHLDESTINFIKVRFSYIPENTLNMLNVGHTIRVKLPYKAKIEDFTSAKDRKIYLLNYNYPNYKGIGFGVNDKVLEKLIDNIIANAVELLLTKNN